ncbi:MAG: hypothetical protein CVT64_05820 [Actinobacteria bacterium HGW-Actinobacteria-4]|nr:MAG: hypothetical protein CVT64_05820 [Actinobacteria bacterium HGW-Actinobacteria-4]
MTDFRFHVVSITAIFLALAVGVVLGSGPMRTAFVGELAQEVDILEEQLAQAQADIEFERAQAAIGEQFVDEASSALTGGTLDGATVAIVAILDADPADVEAQRVRLVQAGATVAATVVLSEGWTDPDQGAFRAALASQIAANVVDVDGASAPDRLLAHALAQALMPDLALDSEVEDPSVLDPGLPGTETATDRSAVLVDLLRQADLLAGTVTSSVDGVVFVSGPGPSDDDRRARFADVFAQMSGVIEEYGAAVVVASGPENAGDVPEAIRNSANVSARVSSVSFGLSTYGRFSVVLALAEQYAGGYGHYGPGERRDFVPERVVTQEP